MVLAYMFPGQGSQKQGMGETLFNKYPHLLAQANDILGFELDRLCLNSDDTQLNYTRYTQPALFVVNALSYIDKIESTGKFPDLVLGHSLGELNALFAAGAIDFATGVKIVNKRAELMAEVKLGAMTAVIGLPLNELKQLLHDENLVQEIDIANINSPKQIVIAAAEEDIAKVEQVLKNTDILFKRLKVSGAFHSRYMNKVAQQFAEFLNSIRFSSLNCPVVANVDTAEYTITNITQKLSAQICSPVQWLASVHRLVEKYPSIVFEEVGPGRVLTALIKQSIHNPGELSHVS